MWGRFAIRSGDPEIMDDLNCRGRDLIQTLKELEVVNRWLGGNRVTLDGVSKILAKKRCNGQVLEIIDLGCGGGDMLKLVADWARRTGIRVHLTGVDANPHVIEYAKLNTRDYPEITCKALNIFSRDFENHTYDIAMCTLFTHHFNNSQLEVLLKTLRDRSKLGVVINDLHRHWFAYYAIKWITGLFSRSYLVRHDAPLSVLRAFTRAEIQSIMRRLDIDHYDLRWMWAFRWQLIF